MTLRITFNGKQAGAQLNRSMSRNADAVRAAVRQTANIAADRIETEGHEDIKSAGKFSDRWTDAFHATVGEGGGFFKISVTMTGISYWKVFQFGAVIHGKPLLWIPLPWVAEELKGVRARDYPGQLFRVNREGKSPLLMAPGKPAEAKYFGRESVTIPKKFHLIEIAKNVARDLPAIYRDVFRSPR